MRVRSVVRFGFLVSVWRSMVETEISEFSNSRFEPDELSLEIDEFCLPFVDVCAFVEH